MKKNILFNLLVLIGYSTSLVAQKTISEGTLTYNIRIQNSGKANASLPDSASTIIYLKGSQSRTDMINSLGSETTIADSKAGTAVILKQYSGQKLMITLTKENWDDKYSKYDGIVFAPTAETKEIAGYSCRKTIAHLKDGTTFPIYYAPDINVINKGFIPLFKTLPGLPVQYEFTLGNHIFSYTLAAVNLGLVPAAKFDIPKAGYRVMSYGSGN